nr:endolytic transglycosylase MltG [uncultured Dysosmobacter sp.]
MSDFKKGDTASWDAEQVRRSEPQRRPRQTTARKRRRKKRINPLLYILFVLITSAILAGVGWLLITDLCAFNKEYMETTVEITADDTVKTVADKLNDAGLIKYKWFFRLFAGVTKADEKIGMGTYTLTTDMDYQALIRGMRSSAGNMTAETVKVTIPEGYTVSQIIKLLAKNGVAAEETLLKVAQTYQFDYDFIDNTSEDISRLEGYLFPDTYEFYANITSESQVGSAVFGKLLSTFNSRIDDELLEAMAAKGYDMHDIVTIASLIEKETDGTDQGMIASVIYNRLEGPGDKAGTYGMLQIDASLLYALPDHEGAITSADMETDSPYNLYKYAGLPPTPISNPGLASIQAALEPEETDYYYYALGTDGKHHYFTNYNDFLNFVNSSQYGG